jgi:hypothetical protein
MTSDDIETIRITKIKNSRVYDVTLTWRACLKIGYVVIMYNENSNKMLRGTKKLTLAMPHERNNVKIEKTSNLQSIHCLFPFLSG